MDKRDIAALGRSYKQVTGAKVKVYEMAQSIAGGEIEVYAAGVCTLTELEAMTDFQVGVLLAQDWGIDVPNEWLAGVIPAPAMPGRMDIH